MPVSIVVVALDSDSLEFTVQVDLDLTAVWPTHLNLPCGTTFVLSLHTDSSSTTG